MPSPVRRWRGMGGRGRELATERSPRKSAHGSNNDAGLSIMLKNSLEPLQPPTASTLAKAFSRSGRLGFWLQPVLGSIPVVLMVVTFAFAHSPVGPGAGLPIAEYLTLASLLILLFTTFWFWR